MPMPSDPPLQPPRSAPAPRAAPPQPDAAGPNAAGPNAAGPNATGPNATGPNATGPNAKGPNAAGPDAQPRRRRQRRKAERPGEILAAALESFAIRGYAATRMDDVAAAAGISKGTLYLYYPTKEDLFRAVVRQSISPIVSDGRITAEESETASGALRILAERALDLLDGPAMALPKLVLTEAGNFPAIASFYAQEVVARANATFELLRKRGVAAGEFQDMGENVLMPLAMAPMLFLALWQHSLAAHSSMQIDARRLVRAHIDLLLRGLAATP